MLDFSLAMYRSLCDGIRQSGREVLTVRDLVTRAELAADGRCMILRHDVDRGPRHAEAMGELERDLGLRSSYYFRTTRSAWDERVMRKIVAMGHEVGLHYECLDKAKGDVAKAAEIFRHDLARARAVCPIATVAMHGNPSTPWDNRDLWRELTLSDFGLLGEAYLSVDFGTVLYYGDSGRTWADTMFNVKDVVPDGVCLPLDQRPARRTAELMEIIRTDRRNVYLLVHPNRWPATVAGWVVSWGTDQAFNWAKLAFKAWRRIRGIRVRRATVAAAGGSRER